MNTPAHIDLETDIIQRDEFVKFFFDKLDDVVWVLGKFCERAEWLMERDGRFTQVIAEMHLAATEVEDILKYAEVFDQNMSEMLLLANSCTLSDDFNQMRKTMQNTLSKLPMYCSNELADMSRLLKLSEEENEPTKTLNRQFLKSAYDVLKNFLQVLNALFFYIDHAYKSFEEVNDAQMKTLYDRMYMQYCSDNVQMLQEYADEVDDVREAKNELKEMFSRPALLHLYKRNVGKPHMLIREMRKQCLFENHLVEIFAYRAKMEKLKGMKEQEATPKIEIKEVVLQKNIENEFHNVEKGATGVKKEYYRD